MNGKVSRPKKMTILRLVGVAFFFTILPVAGHALTPGQVFDKVKDAVVVVKNLDAQGKLKAQGSGVLVSSGRVATNCHVIEGGGSYQVGRGKTAVSAIVYAEDDDKDICLLDAKGIEGKPVQLGKAAGLKVGDPVYAVGAPKGLEAFPFRWHRCAAPGRTATFNSDHGGHFPRFEWRRPVRWEGRLVGLTALYVEGGQSLNFAMPVDWIGEVKPGRKVAAESHGQTEWWKRTIALRSMKDWQGLLDWCRKWTKSEPEYADAWYNLGNAYDYLKRYNDAIEAYRQALRINPKDADAWWSLGFAYRSLERYNDAIEAYRQALGINPEFAEAWYNLGNAYDYLKRYNDAIEAYRQALRIDPKDADVWYRLGVAYVSLKRYRDAVEAFRQALRVDPEYATPGMTLGSLTDPSIATTMPSRPTARP